MKTMKRVIIEYDDDLVEVFTDNQELQDLEEIIGQGYVNGNYNIPNPDGYLNIIDFYNKTLFTARNNIANGILAKTNNDVVENDEVDVTATIDSNMLTRFEVKGNIQLLKSMGTFKVHYAPDGRAFIEALFKPMDCSDYTFHEWRFIP